MAVITISRQYGSRGDEVAIQVAENLGYRLFDKRLMAQVAAEVGLSEHEVVDFSEMDYKAQSFIDGLLGVFTRRPGESGTVTQVSTWRRDAGGMRVKAVQKLDEKTSIAMVRGTVQAAQKKGNVVIVGRGGQAILQQEPDVIHVRIEAPTGQRLRWIQEQEGVTSQEAQEILRERDRASRDYLRRFYEVDWADATLYHLVVNTGKVGVGIAAQVIVNTLPALDPEEPSE